MADPLSVLLRVGAELSYRTQRIRHHLAEIGSSEPDQYAQIADTIKTALDRIERQLPITLNTLPVLPAEDRAPILFDHLRLLSHWFCTIHELLLYLPSRPVLPETPATIANVFGGVYQTVGPSHVLGGIFNAFEFDFYEIVTARLPDLTDIREPGERSIVLQLPICDRYSPGSWAVLAHEMGHAIDKLHDISRRVADEIVPGALTPLRRIVRRWSKEIWADLIAAEVIGPAGILSVLAIEYCLYPLINIVSLFNTHPMTIWRLDVVSKYLRTKYTSDHLSSERALYDAAWQYSLSRTYGDPDHRDAQQRASQVCYDRIVQPLADKLAEKIQDVISSDHAIEEQSVARCVHRLSNGLPIGAQGTDRATLRATVAAFRQKDFPSPDERITAFQELAAKFDEVPVPIPTLLLSCFERRRILFERATRDERFLANRDNMKNLCGELARVDELVVNSIRANTVHRHLLDQQVAVSTE